MMCVSSIYCWRMRRLLAANNLAAFTAMPDGNLTKGLRFLKKLPEPVEPTPVEASTPVQPDATSTARTSPVDPDMALRAGDSKMVEGVAFEDGEEHDEGGPLMRQDTLTDEAGSERCEGENMSAVGSALGEDDRMVEAAETVIDSVNVEIATADVELLEHKAQGEVADVNKGVVYKMDARGREIDLEGDEHKGESESSTTV